MFWFIIALIVILVLTWCMLTVLDRESKREELLMQKFKEEVAEELRKSCEITKNSLEEQDQR